MVNIYCTEVKAYFDEDRDVAFPTRCWLVDVSVTFDNFFLTWDELGLCDNEYKL